MNSTEASTARARSLLEQVFELASRLSDGMEREFEAQGLTTARAELLWRLHADGPQTQRMLSDALRCTPRNVTGLVDALEAVGLARREPHPIDRRATLVSLTDQGQHILEDWSRRYDAFADRLFGDIADQELARCEAILGKIVERMRDDQDG